jgi:excisionase family DNA binding protein
MTKQDRAAFRVEEVAKAAGIGRTLVFAEIKSGRLLARKVGRRTLVTEADLRNWLSALPRVERTETTSRR